MNAENEKQGLELAALISTLSPKLDSTCYVFCSHSAFNDDDLIRLKPLAFIRESEGLSLVLERAQADGVSLPYNGTFKRITLTVQSSLQAVGLTAVISQALAQAGIPANIIAGTYHDHLFVPERFDQKALKVLSSLSGAPFASDHEQD